jgi:hypothetical protein
MADPPAPPPPSPPRGSDDDLEPMRRDRGFVLRLAAALLVGALAAAVVGWKLQRSAAGCGRGLLRPGSTVVPPER